jgi:hypothetical protein
MTHGAWLVNGKTQNILFLKEVNRQQFATKPNGCTSAGGTS